jgi:hypothetical protein
MAGRVASFSESAEVGQRAIVGMDDIEIGDVIAIVEQRRTVHRQQPDAIHPQFLEIVQAGCQAREIALAVGVTVRVRAEL